jgi:hypothetical protein
MANSVTLVAKVVGNREPFALGDGSTLAFTIKSFISGTQTFYLNDTLQTLTTHYTISGNTVTFGTAPALGVAISRVVFDQIGRAT